MARAERRLRMRRLTHSAFLALLAHPAAARPAQRRELHIHAPKGAKDAMLLLLKVSGAHMVFPLYFHELESKESEVIFEDDKLLVTTIPLDYRMYVNGFLFKEKNKECKLNADAVQEYGIDS